ncbi:MAG: hypothetical protein WC993_05200 [Methanoculleus sp.]|nr:hypothetical protein [Methanomicrobiales archaeon]
MRGASPISRWRPSTGAAGTFYHAAISSRTRFMKGLLPSKMTGMLVAGVIARGPATRYL